MPYTQTRPILWTHSRRSRVELQPAGASADGFLRLEFQSELHIVLLEFESETQLNSQLPDAWVGRAANRAKAGTGDGRNRVAVVDVIECIEELAAELEDQPLAKREVLGNPNIPVELTSTPA